MKPLISVGIPTFNRAEGLRRAVACVRGQTYTNLEILISDNQSPTRDTEGVARELMKEDSRIRFFRQEENRGPRFNFNFVAQAASSDYFMWAADDDRLESPNLIEELARYAPDHTLTFPNCNLATRDQVFERGHLDVYRDCTKPLDYLLRWCRHGTGYPFYGLYNRAKMKEAGLVLFYEDGGLSYFNEGVFLHRLFLNGQVRFVPDVYITFSVDSGKPDPKLLIDDFKKYFTRTLLLYSKSQLDAPSLELAYAAIVESYTAYLISLQGGAKVGRLGRLANRLRSALVPK